MTSKKIKNQKRKNQSSLRIFNNCDFLPAWRFFEVLKTDDKRYLLDCRELPEYFESLLDPVWNDIVIQFDKLNGEFIFSNAIREQIEDILEVNEYIMLKACFELMQLGDKNSLIILERDFGISIKEISVDSINQVRSRVLRLQTLLQIKELSKVTEVKSEGNEYIKSIIQMSGILNRQLDKDKITVTEWIYLNKECTEIIKIKKEHGRRNTV